MSIITLLTDFGYQDAYVGVMKGVISNISPHSTLIDLTHNIRPQDIWSARFNLLSSYAYFPKGTVHMAVVDPGVGTPRRAIAVEFDQGFFVAPDNGILSAVLNKISNYSIVNLTNPQYWRTLSPSQTFHGRDIFAPIAAHLANGIPLNQLGPKITPQSLISLTLPLSQSSTTQIQGVIQYIDRFGNAVTNIPQQSVANHNWTLTIHQHRLTSHLTYGTVPVGQPLSLIGSHGWVEIAINGGNAAQQLQLKISTPVNVQIHDGHGSDRAVP